MKFDIAIDTHQGERDTMEDFHSLDRDFQGNGSILGGIYDGHGGAEVAQFMAKELPQRLAAIDSKMCRYNESFEMAYREINDLVRSKEMIGGTCAANFVIDGNIVFTANAGDVRVLIIRKKSAIQLTVDHRPDDSIERSRILASGGKIEGRRIVGEKQYLALSRTIGDKEFHKFGVISDPHVGVYVIKPIDLMLIATSDGLLEKMRNDDVRILAQEKKDAKDIALHLVRAGIKTGSEDNLCVMVVRFVQ